MTDVFISIPDSALAAVGAEDANDFFSKIIETAISARSKVAEVQARIASIGPVTKAEVAARLAEFQPKLDAIGREIERLQPLVEARKLTPAKIAEIETIAGESAARLCASYFPDAPLE